jgi:hypothetical protein
MTEKPISREKLKAFFRSAKQTTESADNDYRLLYLMGRNVLADVGLASLVLGDFDEEVE